MRLLIKNYNEKSDNFEQDYNDLYHLKFYDSKTNFANKRIVEAYVNYLPIPTNEYKPDGMNISLMDCFYVSITGSDEIIPVTEYAKFLSVLTKFVELFFLVVFFNSLLSLKQEEWK